MGDSVEHWISGAKLMSRASVVLASASHPTPKHVTKRAIAAAADIAVRCGVGEGSTWDQGAPREGGASGKGAAILTGEAKCRVGKRGRGAGGVKRKKGSKLGKGQQGSGGCRRVFE